MWQARIVLVNLCYICITGCPDQKPATPSASQTTPPIISKSAATPQSLAENQVESVVNDRLSVLKDAITWKRCTNGLPTPSSPAVSIIAAINGDSQANYTAWLKYVADHIASGTSLGSDYGQIADNVFVGLTPLPPMNDECKDLNLRDAELPPIWDKTTPYSVGQSFFETFATYDQTTRQLAAQYLAKQ